MPLKIRVPYSEKDIAKKLGAKWNVKNKTWYVPDNINYMKFKKWFEYPNGDVIAKNPFYMAISKRKCWKCGQETPVIAFCADNFLYCDSDDKNNNLVYEEYGGFSFFMYIVNITDDLKTIINLKTPFYKLGYSKTIKQKYWGNHCMHCDSLQGDFNLLEEADSPFSPIDKQAAEEIVLIKLPFEYDLMLECASIQSTTDDFILEYSPRISL